MIIYKATNITNGKSYIGKWAMEIVDMRRQRHWHYAFVKQAQTKFHRALRKYGWDNFKWEVIDKAENHEELNEKEKYWVKHYDTFKNGYNMTLGGDGKWGYKHSDESRRKMSENRVITKEDIIENAKAQGTKPFLVFDIDTGFIVGEYEVIKWCADDLNIKYQSTIGNALNGIYHSAGGYVFIEKDEYSDELLEEKLELARGALDNNGANNPNAKLTVEQVQQIKIMMNDGADYKKIQEVYDISRHVYFNIKSEKQWKDVGVKLNPPRYTIKLTVDDVIEIKKMLNQRIKQRDIAKMFDVSFQLISNIKRGISWSDVVVND